MKNFFLGFLFIFLNMNIPFGDFVVNFLPEFVGYIFILRGIKEFGQYSESFTKAEPAAKFMFIFSFVPFGCNLIGLETGMFMALVISTVLIAGHLYVSHLVVKGIMDIEISTQNDLLGDKLYKHWKTNAYVQGACIVLAIVPFLNLFVLFASIFTAIFLIVAMYKTSDAYANI